MTLDQLSAAILLTPVIFVAALLFLPIDLWLLPFRLIGATWRALIWPVMFLVSLSDPGKADRHRAWWAARSAQISDLGRALLGRP